MTPSTSSRFTDKMVLLTGGAAGIGLAVAQALLDEGAKVFIVDYSVPNIELASQALQSAGNNKKAYLLHYADAADDASVIAFVDKCVEVFGALDVAVLNAGIGGIQKPIWEFSAEEYDLIMRINARGRVFYPLPPLPSLLLPDSTLPCPGLKQQKKGEKLAIDWRDSIPGRQTLRREDEEPRHTR
jgi:NADP-dependent 3-hydroxy acid dehydrogenase YdfG